MSGWLRGIDLDDVFHVAIVRCTLTGRPSCVTEAVVEVTLASGDVRQGVLSCPEGLMYETFVADVAAVNRLLAEREGRS